MIPRWPQDGPKMASWRVLEPLGGQDGPKMEPRGFQGRKSQFVPPMLGLKLGPNFGNFNDRNGSQEASRTTWMTCCVQTPIFRRKWLSRALWTPKNQPKCCTVVKNEVFRSSMQSGSWRGSWDPFWDDFGTQVEAKLGHVGHQVGLQWLFNITRKMR